MDEDEKRYDVSRRKVNAAIDWVLAEIERSHDVRHAFYDGHADGTALAQTLSTTDELDRRIENAHRTMVLHQDACSRARAYGRKLAFEVVRVDHMSSSALVTT